MANKKNKRIGLPKLTVKKKEELRKRALDGSRRRGYFYDWLKHNKLKEYAQKITGNPCTGIILQISGREKRQEEKLK